MKEVNLNTSHVNVNPRYLEAVGRRTKVFKYISCYG